MPLRAFPAQIVAGLLVDIERDNVHRRAMMLALPAVAIEKAVDDSLRVRGVAIYRDDRGDARARLWLVRRRRTSAPPIIPAGTAARRSRRESEPGRSFFDGRATVHSRRANKNWKIVKHFFECAAAGARGSTGWNRKKTPRRWGRRRYNECVLRGTPWSSRGRFRCLFQPKKRDPARRAGRPVPTARSLCSRAVMG